MPSHQERREPLPKGYQFGDAGRPRLAIRFLQQWDITPDLHPTRIPWRRPSENAAEQLKAHAWNVIEGEDHE